MPELPDVELYVEALTERVAGTRLLSSRIKSPFLLRTFEPPLKALEGLTVERVHRLGKRIVFSFPGDLFLVMHLMIAGRLQWKDKKGAGVPGKIGLAAFDFERGVLLFTEASKKQRASLHVLQSQAALKDMDRGGIEPLTATLAEFTEALRCENHTLKRSLTDPTLLSGIGNAYSDEILHDAKMSPVKLTSRLDDDEIKRLFESTRNVLTTWTDRLRAETAGSWPTKVTAFREEMAVHGKFGKPCPVCGAPVQRIAYADNETNYCAPCQTEGKLLADRALSKLLRGDWPKTLAELEERKRRLKEST